MKRLLFLISLLVCYFGIYLCVTPNQCVDEDGNPVDWYVVYKLPKMKDHSDKRIADGIAYAYMTSKTVEEGWILSNKSIMDPESIPGRSVSFLSSKKSDKFLWVLYNNRPKNDQVSRAKGHTKGIVAGDSEGGFWIVHSVQHFPVINVKTYKYPKLGLIYGQHFLCISMNQKTLDSVGEQLITNRAYVFDSSFSSELESQYPTLVKAASHERSTNVKHELIIHSLENQQFLSFAKSNKFNADLYGDWVSEVLRSELFVETWSHQEWRLPSSCNKSYPVYNVLSITTSSGSVTCSFTSNHDHSKFAVSVNPDGPHWVCIGDVNRMRSQYRRGGGTVCLNNKSLWTAYSRIIAKTEPCH